MKRVIQCPKCEAKLSIFDIGKPINQICPKCGEKFTIESERSPPHSNGKAPDPTSEGAKQEPATPAATITIKASSVQPDKKETPTSALEKTTDAPSAGNGAFFKSFVVGTLALIIIMLLMVKLNSQKQYKTLIEHLQYIEKNMATK